MTLAAGCEDEQTPVFFFSLSPLLRGTFLLRNLREALSADQRSLYSLRPRPLSPPLPFKNPCSGSDHMTLQAWPIFELIGEPTRGVAAGRRGRDGRRPVFEGRLARAANCGGIQRLACAIAHTKCWPVGRGHRPSSSSLQPPSPSLLLIFFLP